MVFYQNILQTLCHSSGVVDLSKKKFCKEGGTHEKAFAKRVADVVIYIIDGVIEEIGTPEAVCYAPKKRKTRAYMRNAWEGY